MLAVAEVGDRMGPREVTVVPREVQERVAGGDEPEPGEPEMGESRGEDGLEWIGADAENLPFEAASADAVTIAFGIRNVTDISRVLAEARRVLKPGGRFACLEFSRLAVGALEPLYDVYSFQVIPRVGRLVAKDEAAYRYLVESIRRFPDQERFAGMIRDAGFKRVGYRNFTAGVAALHYGWSV
jgi:demethylmenaquinone methyltransferase/2-methoxy-6-polyprenyl-1,4-benzoquinol methylase